MNNLKTFGIVLAVVILLGGAYTFGAQQKEIKMLRENLVNPNIQNAPQDNLNAIPEITYSDVTPISDTDHIFGNKDAKLALVEYSDFECPFCKSFHPTAEQLINESDGEIKWVYRHLPLRSIHPSALISAIGSECVAKLAGEEAFWEYGKTLMLTTPLSKDVVIKEAVNLGVDEGEFTTCLEDQEIIDTVNKQESDADKTGVRGTPGNIVINTETGKAQIIPGAIPLEQLKQAFESIKQ